MPPEGRLPGYREGRGHGEFVGGVRGWVEGKEGRLGGMGVEEGAEWLKEGLVREAEGKGWRVQEVQMEDVEGYLSIKHDQSTKVIDWDVETQRIEREAEQKAAQPQRA